jgi:hypothetical protein
MPRGRFPTAIVSMMFPVAASIAMTLPPVSSDT